VGDTVRLQQVVCNLLSNAIKFSPPGAPVRMDLRRLDTEVEIAVIDHGCGIHPEFLPRVFERFSQGSPPTASARGGLGLGLSIVRHIVEAHGGTVGAHSDGEGRGSCFTVRLPADAELRSRDAVRGRTGIVPVTRLDGMRVLYVDDNADARELVDAILSAHGATVVTCESADAILATLERDRPDVLISDIEMPGGDGYQLIRALRLREEDADARIPAIALTGATRAEDRIRLLSAGFQLHMPKPVDPSELVVAVAALAARDRSADANARGGRPAT
jgi:CheY-like chemotaxis protein